MYIAPDLLDQIALESIVTNTSDGVTIAMITDKDIDTFHRIILDWVRKEIANVCPKCIFWFRYPDNIYEHKPGMSQIQLLIAHPKFISYCSVKIFEGALLMGLDMRFCLEDPNFIDHVINKAKLIFK